jgi:hypothetical protein
MKIPILKFLMSAVIMGGFSGCSTTPSGTDNSKVADEGYFLSWEQKGQLLGSGRIKDADGIWYDVWVVPGYNQSTDATIKYLKRTGSDFGEYFGSKKYSDLADTSWDMYCFGYDDCLYDFTIKGLPKAWGKYWSTAEERTSKRVFGWWFAYPWALMESTVDPVVRIPLGLGGTALGTVLGTVVVPGYYAVDSAVVGTWHFTVNTVFLPTVACTWNTIIAPPMSLVGQKPSPTRTDGFWVKQIDDPSIAEQPIMPKDVETLAAWGRLLLSASQPFEVQRQSLQKQTQVEHDAINKKTEQSQATIRRKEKESFRAISEDPAQKETLDYLRSRSFDSRRTLKAAGDVRRHLEAQKELSPEEINRIMSLLTRYSPSSTTNQPPLRPKTDPLKHSVEVIKEME